MMLVSMLVNKVKSSGYNDWLRLWLIFELKSKLLAQYVSGDFLNLLTLAEDSYTFGTF